MLYTIDELKQCFYDDIFFIDENKNKNIEKVVFDSRDVCKNCLFFALIGETNDGHKFIENAIENGAICVVGQYIPDNIKNKVENGDISFILVKDSLKAFQKLAIFHRNRLKCKVIGITGNIGKTTTREMMNLSMSAFYKTYTNKLNYNGQIGIPYTICNTPMDTEMLILEMGMSQKGELDIISKIAKPDISIITKIAPAHIGNFNNIEEVVEAKAEIFNGMNKNGYIILDKEGEYYNKFVELSKNNGLNNIITIGKNNNANIYSSGIEFNNDCSISYDLNIDNIKYRVKMNCLIEHNVFNSLFVFAVAKILHLDINKVIKSLEEFKIVNGRGNIENLTVNNKNIFIINDCYNSSPDALKSSIKYLRNIQNIYKDKHTVAIIGDMLELGEDSTFYHQQISQYLIDNNIKQVVLIGECSKVIFDNLPDNIEKLYFKNTSEFESEILNYIKDNDILLFKASRGMHFENLIKKLKNNTN